MVRYKYIKIYRFFRISILIIILSLIKNFEISIKDIEEYIYKIKKFKKKEFYYISIF